jgi:hypothetical protein
MKVFFGILVTFIAVKYLTAHGVYVGFVGSVILWWLIAVVFPKHVHNPIHLARHHGRKFFHAGWHRKVGFPIAGFVVYLTVPIALPLVIFIWLWSLSYKHLKGKYRSIGQRLRRESYDAWTRTARQTTQEIRSIAAFCTVCWRYAIGAYQALKDYHYGRGNQPVSDVGGKDGGNEDQPCQAGGEGTD